jgi:hypothetical protein
MNTLTDGMHAGPKAPFLAASTISTALFQFLAAPRARTTQESAKSFLGRRAASKAFRHSMQRSHWPAREHESSTAPALVPSMMSAHIEVSMDRTWLEVCLESTENGCCTDVMKLVQRLCTFCGHYMLSAEVGLHGPLLAQERTPLVCVAAVV